MQNAFDQMEALMAADALCAYPNHNKPYHRRWIIQQLVKKIFCVVATLREFQSKLLGAEMHTHTDHTTSLILETRLKDDFAEYMVQHFII